MSVFLLLVSGWVERIYKVRTLIPISLWLVKECEEKGRQTLRLKTKDVNKR